MSILSSDELCVGEEVVAMAERLCDFCGEPVDENPIQRGEMVYCSEACAFEAKRSTDCTGRTSSVITSKKVESEEQRGLA